MLTLNAANSTTTNFKSGVDEDEYIEVLLSTKLRHTDFDSRTPLNYSFLQISLANFRTSSLVKEPLARSLRSWWVLLGLLASSSTSAW